MKSATTTDTGDSGHRADVQGVRGLAVLAVVAFHAGAPLPGGYVGVDMFFVVSGFVIAGLLLKELEETGRLGLRRFYARRARRLLPALTLVTIVTLPLVAWIFDPRGPQQFATSTAAAAQGFVANVFLYRHTGYFDASLPDANANPFLHLWSLSVEEQFYLVLPVLLVVVWKIATRIASRPPTRRVVASSVAVISVASFGLSWLMSTGRWSAGLDAPERFAFFAAPTRAWELGTGVLLALSARRLNRLSARSAQVLVFVSGGILVWAVLALEPDSPFPGLAALAPVGGTVGLLVGGAASVRVSAALGCGPLRLIGDLSYAWYLWHWPAIVLAKAVWPTSSLVAPVMAVLSLGVAAMSTRWIERPIRRSDRLLGWRAVGLAAACVALSLSVVGVMRVGQRSAWGIDFPPNWNDYPVAGDRGCQIVNRDSPSEWPGDVCTWTVASPRGRVLVLGDGNAYGAGAGVIDAAAQSDLATSLWSRSACPFVSATPLRYEECARWQAAAWRLVERLDPDVVVLANQGPDYVEPPVGRRRVAGRDGRESAEGRDALTIWAAGLGTTIDRLTARGTGVVVLGSMPDFGPRFPTQSPMRPVLTPPTLSRSEVERHASPVRMAEQAVVAERNGDRVVFVDPTSWLCDASCTTIDSSGAWTYFASSQLTNTGSRLLVEPLDRAIHSAFSPGG